MQTMKIKRLPRDGATPPLPAYQTEGAAAMDLCAFLPEPVAIPPGGRMLVPTGIAIELPAGCAGLVMARSGLATRVGLALANGVGLIDPDYRGEVLVSMLNYGTDDCIIKNGDRVAQLLLVPFVRAELCEGELSDTGRGQGGIGSTGVRG